MVGTSTSSERDPLTQLAMQMLSYPKLPEPAPKRPFFNQATWRIHIPNDMESPVKGLVDGIFEIWAVLKSIDDKLIIYPLKQSNHGRYKALSGGRDQSIFPRCLFLTTSRPNVFQLVFGIF
jgi:hypothetical protein